MSLHSEYSFSNPNWGAPLVTTLKAYYRKCGTILKVKHIKGERVTKWQECGPCKQKATGGYFDSMWSV